jgi:hypothetical protein
MTGSLWSAVAVEGLVTVVASAAAAFDTGEVGYGIERDDLFARGTTTSI